MLVICFDVAPQDDGVVGIKRGEALEFFQQDGLGDRFAVPHHGAVCLDVENRLIDHRVAFLSRGGRGYADVEFVFLPRHAPGDHKKAQ